MAEINRSNVAWPTKIKGTSTQSVIERFFEAADNPTEEGSVAFSECFLPKGELVARGHVCRSHSGKSYREMSAMSQNR